MNKKIKIAEGFLNYKEIGFFEQASINLLTVLLDKYGSIENIYLNKINLSELILQDKYNTFLAAFIEPLRTQAFEQLRDMIYDVKCLILKNNYTIDDLEFKLLGINNKAKEFVNYNEIKS